MPSLTITKNADLGRKTHQSDDNDPDNPAHAPRPVPPPSMFSMLPENMPSVQDDAIFHGPEPEVPRRESQNHHRSSKSNSSGKRRKKRRTKVHPHDGGGDAALPRQSHSWGGHTSKDAELLEEMDATLSSIDHVKLWGGGDSGGGGGGSSSGGGGDGGQPKAAAPERHASNSADNLVERRHLKEICDALQIPFKQAHLDFKDIPLKNSLGVYCDWPYRTLILYHNQGETLDSFKSALMRYEESYLLITGLLMTVGFGATVSVHMTDYWDVWDVETGTQVEEYGWFRMPKWDYVFKIICSVSALSSSLCAFKACTVFTSWFLAVSDTPADLVPVVIARYLVEYQYGRCSHRWPFKMIFGGVLPTDLLFNSLWYLCLAMCCGITLLGGPVAGGVITLNVLMWHRPITEAGYAPYPVGVGARGTYSTSLQWAIDRNYHKA